MASRGGVEIGDSVLYEGRRHLVCGFTMKSSATKYVLLEEKASGERRTVPLADLETAEEVADEARGREEHRYVRDATASRRPSRLRA